MKKLLIPILLLPAIVVQSQELQWEKRMGGQHAEYLYDALPTLDYGVLLVGGTLSDKTGAIEKHSQGDFDYMLSKLDEHGNTEWTKTLGGESTDIIRSICRTPDGGYLLGGLSRSGISGDKTTSHLGNDDIWLIKTNIQGEPQWQKTLGGLAQEQIATILYLADGGYLVAGSSASDNYQPKANDSTATGQNSIYKKDKSRGNTDYWLVRLDAGGEERWQKTIGGKHIDQLHSAVALPDGSIVLGGVSNSAMGLDKIPQNRGLNDWWLIKLDDKGNEQWQKAFGNDADDQLYTLLTTTDGNLLAGGHFSSGNGLETHSDFVVVKLDTDGNVLWENTYDVGQHDILVNVVKNRDGSYLLSGYSATEQTASGKPQKPDEGIEDYVAIKINANGEETWRAVQNGGQKEVLNKAIETRDGGYILMGTSMPLQGNGTNDANFYIVKLKDNEKPPVNKLWLEAAPNPTQTFTAVVVGYDYDQGTCSVVSMDGKVVNSFSINSNRLIPLDMTNYPIGMYIVTIKTNISEDSVKVMKN